jgi:hypothetical protein
MTEADFEARIERIKKRLLEISERIKKRLLEISELNKSLVGSSGSNSSSDLIYEVVSSRLKDASDIVENTK